MEVKARGWILSNNSERPFERRCCRCYRLKQGEEINFYIVGLAVAAEERDGTMPRSGDGSATDGRAMVGSTVRSLRIVLWIGHRTEID